MIAAEENVRKEDGNYTSNAWEKDEFLIEKYYPPMDEGEANELKVYEQRVISGIPMNGKK